MAINIFGKKEKGEKIEPTKKVDLKPKAETKIKEVAKATKSLSAKNNEAWKVLKFPHVTEKVSSMASDNFYAFQVMDRANKPEIKKAIESEYKVKVVDIKIINIPRKRVQRGKIPGFKSGFKKALIRLEQGQKIDIITQ